jgi:ParB/RepB/Spo0J family partition protein
MTEQKMDMALIAIEMLVVSKTNPRKAFDSAEMKELEDSIREKGILQPLLVRPLPDGSHLFEIVCGERRYRAAVTVGLEKVPASIREMDDKTMLEVQLIENMQRSDVHPLEEAEGYEQLMKKYGYDGADQIADRVGKSKSYVYGRLKLCDLIPECRKMFYTGDLNPSTALLIARIPDEMQKKAANDIKNLSYRAACDLIQRDYMLNLKGSGFAKDSTICPDLGSCSTCTKRTGNQNLLFPDIKSADVCTDPVCFETKRKEYVKRQQKKANGMGLRVVETKNAFPFGEKVGGGYVSLDEQCRGDKQKRTYREVLKDADVRPAVSVDPKGKIHEIIKESQAEKVLQKIGVLPNPEKLKEDSNASEKELRKMVSGKAIGLIVEKVKGDLHLTFWKTIAEVLVKRAKSNAINLLAKRIDQTLDSRHVKADEAVNTVEAHFKKLPEADYPAFVCELLSWPEWDGWHEYSETMQAFCELYEIDLKELETPVKSEMETQKAKVETKPAKDETKAVSNETKTPEAKKPAPKKRGEMEFKGADGAKVIVKAKTKLSKEDKKAVEEGMSKIAGLFGKKEAK